MFLRDDYNEPVKFCDLYALLEHYQHHDHMRAGGLPVPLSWCIKHPASELLLGQGPIHG